MAASLGRLAMVAATREGIFEHTDPTSEGYRTRTTCRRGEMIPVRYAATELAVDDLLALLTPLD